MGGKKGYTIVDNVIIQQYLPCLGTGPFALWCILRKRCDYWDKDKREGACHVTLDALARALNLSHRRDVIAYRKPLLDAGLLKVLRKGHSAGYATYYAVIVPQDTSLLDLAKVTAKKLKINGRSKIHNSARASTGTCANYGTSKTRQPVPQLAGINALTGTGTGPQLAHQPTPYNKQPYNQQGDFSNKPLTQQPKTEFLGQKYLEGKSPEELLALEIRARKELEEAGTTDERIIRGALWTLMALIAKEEAGCGQASNG